MVACLMTKTKDSAPKPAPTAPRKLDLQFGPTPTLPGSRLKRVGK